MKHRFSKDHLVRRPRKLGYSVWNYDSITLADELELFPAWWPSYIVFPVSDYVDEYRRWVHWVCWRPRKHRYCFRNFDSGYRPILELEMWGPVWTPYRLHAKLPKKLRRRRVKEKTANVNVKNLSQFKLVVSTITPIKRKKNFSLNIYSYTVAYVSISVRDPCLWRR